MESYILLTASYFLLAVAQVSMLKGEGSPRVNPITFPTLRRNRATHYRWVRHCLHPTSYYILLPATPTTSYFLLHLTTFYILLQTTSYLKQTFY